MEIILWIWCWNCYIWHYLAHPLTSTEIIFLSFFPPAGLSWFLTSYVPFLAFVHRLPGAEPCSLQCKLVGDIMVFNTGNFFLI